MSAHTHVHDLAAVAACAEENPAAPLHLHALLQKHLLIRRYNSILHCPRNTRTGRGACGWILTVIKNHARLQFCCWIQRLPGNKIEKLSVSLLKINFKVGPRG